MTWFITNLIAEFLLPPLNFLLVLVVGIFLLKTHQRLAKALLLVSTSLLWLCATPYCADMAMHWLESSTQPLTKPLPPAQAIVILGGGTYFKAPEYGYQDTVNWLELARLRYGAKLQRATQLPVLVTGGKPVGNELAEAQQMREVLEQEFQVPVRWQEGESTTTYENALFSQKILQKEGINSVYLVTHAMHMRRAADTFRRLGYQVVEAPTAFTTRYRTDVLAFIPNAAAMRNSQLFFHEIIGIVWYKMKP